MIGTPEIVFIAVVAVGSVVYALVMKKANSPSQNAQASPLSSTPNIIKPDRKIKKIEKDQGMLVENQHTLNKKVEKLQGTVQDLEIALKLKPDEKELEIITKAKNDG